MNDSASQARRRSGRNVPVATAVGVALAALVLLTLYTVTFLFVGLVTLAVMLGVFEVCRVLGRRGIDVPLVPVVVGGAAMVIAAYVDGTDALTAALVLTVVAMTASRVFTPAPERLVKDVVVGTFVAVLSGTVLLGAVVLADGTVGNVTVTRSLDTTFGLDQEAVKAAKQWKFKPGTKDGKPVAVRVQIELTFTLK